MRTFKTSLPIASALGAVAAVVTLGLAACGGDDSGIPANAVASIDGTPIARADYQRWAAITARGSAQQGASVIVPDPPSFARCIAAERKQTRVARGQPKPTDASLRTQCRQLNDTLVTQTMGTLIQQQWIQREAKDQGLSVTDAEVRRQLADTKRQSFPTEKDYRRFLKQSGMTPDDVLSRIRVQALAQKLTRKVQSGSVSISGAEIKSYYTRNAAQFAVPERRDVELILTRSRAEAGAAAGAVRGGTSWATAARRYSTDPTSKSTGGKLSGVTKGQQDRAFDRAAFSAAKGRIVGPVKGQFGWYVLRVTNVTPPRRTSLADAREQIRAMLQQAGQQRKMSTFVDRFQRHWRAETNCRAGYIVPLCSNAPKPSTTSTPTTAPTAAAR